VSLTSLCDKTVAIERMSTALDGWGGSTETYAEVAKAKARIRPVSGRDAIIASKPDLRVSHVLYFPGTPVIQSGDRFKFGARYFYVQNIRNVDEQGIFLTVDCEERSA
jgi:head-tail adaptor